MRHRREPYSHTVDRQITAPEMWTPVFGEFMERGSRLRENVCTLLMLGARPIAVVTLLFALKLYQWLS